MFYGSQSAFYHQSPANEKPLAHWPSKDKKSDPHSTTSTATTTKRGYVRLDSLEGTCRTIPSGKGKSTLNNKMDSIDKKTPPSRQESRWFGHYHQTDSHHQDNSSPFFSSPQQVYHPHQHQWPVYQQQQQYQMPFNLTKGQYEVWATEAVGSTAATASPMQSACLRQRQQQQHQQPGFLNPAVLSGNLTRCVSSLFQWVPSALVNAFSSSMTMAQVEEQEVVLRAQFYEESAYETPSPSSVSSSPERTNPTTSTSLNPNAKSFTPLNPNAKEFHPSSNNTLEDQPPQVPEQEEVVVGSETVPEVDDCITPPPEINESLRAVAYRKCTPWLGNTSPMVMKKGAEEILDESDIIVATAFSDESALSSCDEEEEEEEECEDAGRPRLYSICSSEDGGCSFIQFEESSPAASSASKNNPSKKRRPSFENNQMPKVSENCSQFLKNFLVGADEDDDTSEDDDDDGDWDAAVDAIFIDDENLLEECGLKCQWIVQQPTPKSPTRDEPDCCISTNKKSLSNILKDSFPFANDLDHNELLKKVNKANEKWNEMYLVGGGSSDTLDRAFLVVFAEPLVSGVLLEDPDIASDLRAARLSDKVQRDADKARFERILGPIFEVGHRETIRAYIDRH